MYEIYADLQILRSAEQRSFAIDLIDTTCSLCLPYSMILILLSTEKTLGILHLSIICRLSVNW